MDKNLNCSLQTIKSYVFRQGRLTSNQKDAIANANENKFAHYQATSATRVSRPVVLEIGFGDGRSLLQQAMNHPEMDFIGVEVYPPGVGQLLSQCRSYGLENLFVYQGDIASFLAEDNIPVISKVQVYFPDPWHKRRHQKRRLISKPFIEQIEKAIAFGGLLHILTDWDDYADHIHEVMQGVSKFKKTAIQARFERAKTKYEQRALRLGHTIHEFLYVLG